MSSKKVASKETKAAEKKPVAKKTATASAAKKPAAKPAAEAKSSKAAPAKEPVKAASKAAPKAASKPAAKAPAKEVKPAAKAAPAKAPAKEVAKAAPAPKAEPKVEPKAEPKVESKVEAKAAESKVDSKYDYAVLLEGVKKLSKAVMFVEIDEQEDRSNKKKMSSEMKNLEMKPTAAIRHKASLAEETQEELTERILKELEEQNLAFEREAASQMCTRCNRNLVSPEFWVDKHLGYCEECAMILKLGQSKEARKVEYQLGGMGDSLDEEDEDILGPDADDLKEAEEDLAEMDD